MAYQCSEYINIQCILFPSPIQSHINENEENLCAKAIWSSIWLSVFVVVEFNFSIEFISIYTQNTYYTYVNEERMMLKLFGTLLKLACVLWQAILWKICYALYSFHFVHSITTTKCSQLEF